MLEQRAENSARLIKYKIIICPQHWLLITLASNGLGSNLEPAISLSSLPCSLSSIISVSNSCLRFSSHCIQNICQIVNINSSLTVDTNFSRFECTFLTYPSHLAGKYCYLVDFCTCDMSTWLNSFNHVPPRVSITQSFFAIKSARIIS